MGDDTDPTSTAELNDQEEDFLRALARVMLYVPRAFASDLGRRHGLFQSEFFPLMYMS